MKRILVISLLLIVAFILGTLVRSSGTGRVTQQSMSNDTPAPQNESDAEQTTTNQTTRQYQSPFGFSFTYDTQYQLVNSTIVLPDSYRVAAITVVRYVHEHFCSAAGLREQCSPLLENPAIAFGVIDATPATVVARHLLPIKTALQSLEIAGTTAAQYYAATNGEGIVTVLVPLKNPSKTLVIQYTYDEIFDDLDLGANILSSVEQKQIVDTVLHTLTIE